MTHASGPLSLHPHPHPTHPTHPSLWPLSVLAQRPCSQFWRQAGRHPPFEPYNVPNDYDRASGIVMKCGGYCDEVGADRQQQQLLRWEVGADVCAGCC